MTISVVNAGTQKGSAQQCKNMHEHMSVLACTRGGGAMSQSTPIHTFAKYPTLPTLAGACWPGRCKSLRPWLAKTIQEPEAMAKTMHEPMNERGTLCSRSHTHTPRCRQGNT
eukprot:scaffold113415_cov22-Tisochrysis_lutea.AAC.2